MLTVELFTTKWSLLLVSAFLVLFSHLPKPKKSTRQTSAQWIKGGSTWLSRLFAPWICALNPQTVLQDCYEQVNETQQPRLLPSFLGSQIMLPSSWIPWLVAQPEASLNVREFQANMFNFRTSLLHKDLVDNPVQVKVLLQKLKIHRQALTKAMMTEIEYAFEQEWGTDTQKFVDVTLTPTLRKIVYAATNRILVGQDLCRNRDYIDSAVNFIQTATASGMLLNLFPECTKPILGNLFTLPIKYMFSRSARHLEPLFDAIKIKFNKDPKDLPQVFSTWAVEDAMNHSVREHDKTSELLSLRVLMLNLAMGHNTAIVCNTTLLDALSAPAQDRCVEVLTAESHKVALTYGSTWNRPRFQTMIKVDSAIHESMRLSSFITRVLNRRVIAPEGVLLPDGTYVPRGATVCIGGYGIQHDPSIYQDPMAYHYDRFLEQVPSPPVNHGCEPLCSVSEESQTTEHEAAPLRLTHPAASADPTHLIWGLGKRACPERQFAVDLVKMIVSHALVKYEIEPIAIRPKNIWFEYHMVPSPTATLRVRRRAG